MRKRLQRRKTGWRENTEKRTMKTGKEKICGNTARQIYHPRTVRQRKTFH